MNARGSAEPGARVALALLTLLAVSACAPRTARVALPGGAGAPLDPAVVQSLSDAMTGPCRDVRALTADLRIAGRVDGEKVRGTLQVGVADDAVRMEGVPPFGAPVFVLAGRAASATLLFSRDHAYVPDAPVAALTEAIVGVALTPRDLLALLGGCGVPAAEAQAGWAYGGGWVKLDLAGGLSAWLTTPSADARVGATLRVAETGDWRVDYEPRQAGAPLRGALHRKTGAATDLSFVVEAPEFLPALPEAALDVVIPSDARAIPIERLRAQRALAEP